MKLMTIMKLLDFVSQVKMVRSIWSENELNEIIALCWEIMMKMMTTDDKQGFVSNVEGDFLNAHFLLLKGATGGGGGGFSSSS